MAPRLSVKSHLAEWHLADLPVHRQVSFDTACRPKSVGQMIFCGRCLFIESCLTERQLLDKGQIKNYILLSLLVEKHLPERHLVDKCLPANFLSGKCWPIVWLPNVCQQNVGRLYGCQTLAICLPNVCWHIVTKYL